MDVGRDVKKGPIETCDFQTADLRETGGSQIPWVCPICPSHPPPWCKPLSPLIFEIHDACSFDNSKLIFKRTQIRTQLIFQSYTNPLRLMLVDSDPNNVKK
jgi:hypothetical protein